MLFWSTIIYFIWRHGLRRTVNLQQTNATCVKCVFQQQNSWHTQVSDARSQLRFLEEIESLQKKKRDEEERERLLHFARVGGARIRLHSYQKQSLHSNTISVFRLNVSLKTTTENSLCIKSWVTCLVDHRAAPTLKIQSISSSSKKPKRCVSFSKLSTGVGSHSSTVYVGVCELCLLWETQTVVVTTGRNCEERTCI